nr:hypothetical protein [Alphapermutotetravirus sp.]
MSQKKKKPLGHTVHAPASVFEATPKGPGGAPGQSAEDKYKSAIREFLRVADSIPEFGQLTAAFRESVEILEGREACSATIAFTESIAKSAKLKTRLLEHGSEFRGSYATYPRSVSRGAWEDITVFNTCTRLYRTATHVLKNEEARGETWTDCWVDRQVKLRLKEELRKDRTAEEQERSEGTFGSTRAGAGRERNQGSPRPGRAKTRQRRFANGIRLARSSSTSNSWVTLESGHEDDAEGPHSDRGTYAVADSHVKTPEEVEEVRHEVASPVDNRVSTAKEILEDPKGYGTTSGQNCETSYAKHQGKVGLQAVPSHERMEDDVAREHSGPTAQCKEVQKAVTEKNSCISSNATDSARGDRPATQQVPHDIKSARTGGGGQAHGPIEEEGGVHLQNPRNPSNAQRHRDSEFGENGGGEDIVGTTEVQSPPMVNCQCSTCVGRGEGWTLHNPKERKQWKRNVQKQLSGSAKLAPSSNRMGYAEKVGIWLGESSGTVREHGSQTSGDAVAREKAPMQAARHTVSRPAQAVPPVANPEAVPMQREQGPRRESAASSPGDGIKSLIQVEQCIRCHSKPVKNMPSVRRVQFDVLLTEKQEEAIFGGATIIIGGATDYTRQPHKSIRENGKSRIDTSNGTPAIDGHERPQNNTSQASQVQCQAGKVHPSNRDVNKTAQGPGSPTPGSPINSEGTQSREKSANSNAHVESNGTAPGSQFRPVQVGHACVGSNAVGIERLLPKMLPKPPIARATPITHQQPVQNDSRNKVQSQKWRHEWGYDDSTGELSCSSCKLPSVTNSIRRICYRRRCKVVKATNRRRRKNMGVDFGAEKKAQYVETAGDADVRRWGRPHTDSGGGSSPINPSSITPVVEAPRTQTNQQPCARQVGGVGVLPDETVPTTRNNGPGSPEDSCNFVMPHRELQEGLGQISSYSMALQSNDAQRCTGPGAAISPLKCAGAEVRPTGGAGVQGSFNEATVLDATKSQTTRGGVCVPTTHGRGEELDEPGLEDRPGNPNGNGELESETTL